MQSTILPFIPAVPPAPNIPLGRFLPPLARGAVAAWLAREVPAGSWLLDPFGAEPELALEAARAGYRVLVVSNNPILTFMLEILASAPQPADFKAALAELAASHRNEERLEIHLKSLYQTSCAACSSQIQAQGFLWRRDEELPYARLYHCPHCGDEGEHPLDPSDVARLTLPGNISLHRARALSRVADPSDEHYLMVKEALEAYLPRPLYVLSTLINKQEGLSIPPAQRRLLQALLISVCDAASPLWSWPTGRTRPRQLSVPSQFCENNLWSALENAAEAWGRQPSPIPLTRWPELPPPGGICLFQGRVKGLLPLPEELPIAAVLTVFPRPNQAFWTLSAMWSGWLWGREASLPLHSILGRRRFDWSWHASAIHSPLSALGRSLPANTPLLGILPEIVPGFLTAVLSASEAAGFRLEAMALRGEEELAFARWRCLTSASTSPEAKPPANWSENEAERTYQEAIQSHLADRAEPAHYLLVHAAGMSALAQSGQLPGYSNQFPNDLFTRLQSLTARIFANRKLLRRYERNGPQRKTAESPPRDDEHGLWWLTAPTELLEPPLADRIEMETVNILKKSSGISLLELDTALCQAFPGLFTPSPDLVQAILESYAEEIPGQLGKWRLLAQENPASRRADLDETRRLLREIGERMSYTVSGETPLVWTPSSYGQVYFFYSMASSLVGRYVLSTPPAPVRQCVMVFPGGRARLLSFKLRRDPRLAEAISGWHLLKFRHLRELYEQSELTPALWDTLLDTDPPFFEDAVQMSLL
jgi:hypothetical protein